MILAVQIISLEGRPIDRQLHTLVNRSDEESLLAVPKAHPRRPIALNPVAVPARPALRRSWTSRNRHLTLQILIFMTASQFTCSWTAAGSALDATWMDSSWHFRWSTKTFDFRLCALCRSLLCNMRNSRGLERYVIVIAPIASCQCCTELNRILIECMQPLQMTDACESSFMLYNKLAEIADEHCNRDSLLRLW